jgi:hypothetical protein
VEKQKADQDQGHRHGNFPNYYAFNPPSNRLVVMKEILEHVTRTNTKNRHSKSKEHVFSYCDVGCNEGDLTMEVAKAIMQKSSPHLTHISVRGVDLDRRLVERANQKFQQSNDPNHNHNPNMSVEFVTADVCSLEELNEHIPNDLNLLSLFSTTMWLHIHVGDDGFRKLLESMCEKSNDFILIEPQASKSYRSASVRLRKQGLGALDVSTERLKLRARIEEEIDKILSDNHFVKVDITTNRTEWNRSIRLYERIQKKTDQT